MCTNVTLTTGIGGSGLGAQGWFAVDEAVVYFDHPQDVPVDHALCIDFRRVGAPADERVAVELDSASARRLAETILATLDHPEVSVYL